MMVNASDVVSDHQLAMGTAALETASDVPTVLTDETEVFNYETADLDAIKDRIEEQTPEQVVGDIRNLPIKRLAQILSYDPILKQSGKIFMELGETKALETWNEIHRQDMYDEQDNQRPRQEWDSNLLGTAEQWNNATVKHFRHWIKYNSANIEKHVNTANIDNFLIALIGRLDQTLLNLSHKDLTAISPIIKQLTWLHKLDLKRNQLSSLSPNAFKWLN